MDWLTTLITHESVARTVVLLGVAGVLFAGLVLGHLKLSFHHEVLDFVREFGLILFVYTLGLQIGPGFFGSLRAG